MRARALIASLEVDACSFVTACGDTSAFWHGGAVLAVDSSALYLS
jgi:hypothetical protein